MRCTRANYWHFFLLCFNIFFRLKHFKVLFSSSCLYFPVTAGTTKSQQINKIYLINFKILWQLIPYFVENAMQCQKTFKYHFEILAKLKKKTKKKTKMKIYKLLNCVSQPLLHALLPSLTGHKLTQINRFLNILYFFVCFHFENRFCAFWKHLGSLRKDNKCAPYYFKV